MFMRAIAARETLLLLTAGRARIMAALRTARVTRVPATRLTHRVRLATIRTGRLRQIRVADTTNEAQLHSVPIIRARRVAGLQRRRSAHTRHRNSVPTLRR